MGATAVVKGFTLRVTKVNSCGLPLEGAANRLVTKGFIRFNMAQEVKARNDLEQNNAAGEVIVSDSTPAQRKWWNTEIQVAKVDPDLFSLLCRWTRIVDPDGNPIGVRDRATVDGDTGVMLELWTGGEGDDDCPPPTSDAIFSAPASGRNYGYIAITAKEFVSGDWTVEEAISTFTLSGRSFAPKQWGRGPYNVANIANAGDPVEAGRLLSDIYSEDDDNHFVFFRTPVPPPSATDGAVPLDITGLFAGPPYYFGASAADVAPEQAEAGVGFELSISGTPTGGTTTLVVQYPEGPDLETGTIAYNASAANVKTALVALDDGYTSADWTTSGGALPGTAVTIIPPQGVVITEGTDALTGGTDPESSVDPA